MLLNTRLYKTTFIFNVNTFAESVEVITHAHAGSFVEKGQTVRKMEFKIKNTMTKMTFECNAYINDGDLNCPIAQFHCL